MCRTRSQGAPGSRGRGGYRRRAVLPAHRGRAPVSTTRFGVRRPQHVPKRSIWSPRNTSAAASSTASRSRRGVAPTSSAPHRAAPSMPPTPRATATRSTIWRSCHAWVDPPTSGPLRATVRQQKVRPCTVRTRSEPGTGSCRSFRRRTDRSMTDPPKPRLQSANP